jgi:abequosyltransferase
MINSQPLLSICIPTYNRASFLAPCLDSILLSIKGFENEVEIIISDNASSDNTQDVVAIYKEKSPFILYNLNNENKIDENFWIAATLAKGKFIWLLGDNRNLFEDSIRRILKEIEAGYNLIITNFTLYSENDKKIVKEKYYGVDKNIVFNNHNHLLKYFGIGLGHISQVIFDRNVLNFTSYVEYMQFVKSGWPFLYLVYKGVFKNTNAVFLNESFYLKKAKMIKCDWEKHFVIGSAFILNRIKEIGYDNKMVSQARNKTIKHYIIPLLVYDKKNNSAKFSRYSSIYRNYKSSSSFWLYCLPIIMTPSFLIKLISIYRKILK